MTIEIEVRLLWGGRAPLVQGGLGHHGISTSSLKAKPCASEADNS
jgi:hypothetical protein